MLERQERQAQEWEQLLYVTGGALELEKCYFYAVKHAKKGLLTKMASAESAPGVITLTNSNTGECVEIPRKEPWEGVRTLGVRLCPEGNMQAEMEFRIGQSQELGKLVGRMNLTPAETWLFYKMIWKARLGYPLAITTFTNKQLWRIEKESVGSILSGLGLNRAFPRAVTHASEEMGGIGITPLWVEQGIKKIQLIQKHVRARTHVGSLLLIALGWHQLDSGVSEPVWSTTKRVLTYAEPTWMSSVTGFLQKTQLQLRIRDQWVPRAQREHDRAIMDADTLSSFGTYEQKQINKCRVYARLYFMSDIVGWTGLRIEGSARRGVRARSTWQWPKIPKPDDKDWRVWRRFLGTLEQGGCIQQPLGKWVVTPHKLTAAYIDTEGKYWIEEIEGFRHHRREGGELYETEEVQKQRPDTWWPAHVIFRGGKREVGRKQNGGCRQRWNSMKRW
jgi:hypothetical protein